MSFFATKSDLNIKKDLFLQQPDMYVSEILLEDAGIVSKSSNDITLTPEVSPVLVIDALKSAVGQNIEVQDSAGVCYVGKIKSNDAVSVTFDSTLTRRTDTGAIGAPGSWTEGGSVNFYAMTPHQSALWGDYFGVVKEPDMSQAEEYATVEDVDGIIAEGLIKVELDITGQNKNVTNGDVLKAVLNLTAQGAQSGNVELHGGFRPEARPKFRATFIGTTQAKKDFIIQYFYGKLRAEGSLAPTGEEYAQLGWGYKPQSDSLRNKTVNAYLWKIAK